jgi:hypothetical protein
MISGGNSAARSAGLGSSHHLCPSAEALGYFHFVCFADDRVRYRDFLGKAKRHKEK